MTETNVVDLDETRAKRETAADRRSQPNLAGIAEALADKYGTCRRPLVMYAYDPSTGDSKYVGAPCKSTQECQCPGCAARALRLRQQQCREGWHIEEEPVNPKPEPTERQIELFAARAQMQVDYDQAKDAGDSEAMDGIREVVHDLDAELRSTGVRGRLPGLDPQPTTKRQRSTKRRQDAADLPRKKVARSTIGRQFAGKYRPSMFMTLTLPSYGKVYAHGHPDAGAPINPETYDYRRAARDIVHAPALFDRFMQNYRRAVGYDVQYFATVEPQKRGAPHWHVAARGTAEKELIRQVVAGTYHQVWWPNFDHEEYSDGHMPTWDYHAKTFVDSDTGHPLPGWDEVMELIDSVDEYEPAHVVRLGSQVDAQGVLGGTEEAGQKVGYLTKYLTKSIGEIVEADTARLARHYDRLHEELCKTPCSPKCGVWLRYGIVPKGATEKMVPGRCKGKAHRRETLGMRGRRVLVSRRWTGKTLADHQADRVDFVREMLREAGISRPDDRDRWVVRPSDPGDPNKPPREHLIMNDVTTRLAWRYEYDKARLFEPPTPQGDSANQDAA
ncbi:replication initiator [Nocardia terpenica]|uniref:Replication initiator protein n=1 Tax=Nocardia terpenica TaxID=455432 RepID=A0A164NZ16_9NOCA|nr:replication initiator [Nocardia terpenica]KZM73822.1 replication initiator protein [Nocardia terpenica]KZM74903.1 replication initiator protein [Nocardia terpenica]NQE86907.1 replication initiator protein [Nocardia terpenica]NQE93439.1 replication initiator protein [Nocardia terpenica]